MEVYVKTHTVKKADIKVNWYYVDAKDLVLGRLSTRIAHVLRGKHRPDFSPHLDLGDHVIVLNAKHVKITGRKPLQKIYTHYSGYQSGLKQEPFKTIIKKNPIHVIKHAVRGMLPHNRLGRIMLKKLKVYPVEEHPHKAQKPQPLDSIIS